jgi:general secretion pathway protein G
MNVYRFNKKALGFSLLEMLVVLVIMGLLAGLVGPRLFDRADKAKVQAADQQIKMLKGALLTLRLDINRLPTTEEGLGMLSQRPDSSDVAEYWQGPYLDDNLPMDPWNRPYRYSSQPTRNQPFSLYSYGADGQPGGEGYDADIGYLPDL